MNRHPSTIAAILTFTVLVSGCFGGAAAMVADPCIAEWQRMCVGLGAAMGVTLPWVVKNGDWVGQQLRVSLAALVWSAVVFAFHS